MSWKTRIGGALIFVLISASTAWACGTIDLFSEAYFGRGKWAGRISKLDCIHNLGQCAYSYKGEASDRKIFAVLLDASLNYAELVRGPNPASGLRLPYKILFEAYSKYHCLPGAASHKDYPALRGYFIAHGLQKELQAGCGVERFRNLYRVAVSSGVNVRQKPAKSSPRVGGLKSGQVVKAFATQGAWLRVNTKMIQGFVHGSLLKKLRAPE